MSRPEDIYSALLQLGDDADQIASNLSTLGCRGVQESSTSCPVYVYLDRRLGGIESVDLGTVEFINEDDRPESVDTPDAVDEFIDRFDAGQFPGLVVS